MPADAAQELIRRGREALADASWNTARACFEQAQELSDSAQALDGLSRALHFQGHYGHAIQVTERAFVAYGRQGQPVEAADCARLLAFLHGTINGNMAVASGWITRAEELLGAAEECAAHGWLALDRAPLTDDVAERERLAAAALSIGRRFGDADLKYDALALLGESYVAAGRVPEGMRLIDEAMTAVSAGEVAGVVPVGDIYCRLMSACEIALDATRAEQWMSVAGDFAAWSDFVSPVCRSHYGGILIAAGRWSDAERELVTAIRTFEGGYRAMRGSPLVRLADLRVRQGRIDEARRLLEGQESQPLARQLLATIAQARGDLVLAEDLLVLCLDSRAASDPACAPTLELMVQVRRARNDLRGANHATEQLEELASSSGDSRAAAFAELAMGRVRAAEGHEAASGHLQEALRDFEAVGLPLEASRARLELAKAISARGPRAAIAEARLALQSFEHLGASADADAAAALLRELDSHGRTWPKHYGALTKRETEVLSLLADGSSNREIAERLHISPRTAEHHVAHILSKLELRNRAEAAAYAVREPHEDQ